MNWSWVTTADLVAERRNHARQLTGSRLAAVSYVLIDYGRLDRSTGSHGSRLISDSEELASPAWRYRTFDCADYAVEFTTEAGRVFTVSWDTPGDDTGSGSGRSRLAGLPTSRTRMSPCGTSAV